MVTVVLPAAAIAAGLLALSAAAATGSVARTAAVASATAKTAGSFHETKTMSRINLIGGKNVVVDKRTVTLTVTNTANLINRQPLNVSWSGAHPTGGIDPDGPNPNGDISSLGYAFDGPAAADQEYPMVLLECHGTAKTITPEDCWTTEYGERVFEGSYSNLFPPWRLDRYATAADQRNQDVGIPNPLPANCAEWKGLLAGAASYWLPYVNSSGRKFSIGMPYTESGGIQGECGGAPGEMDELGGISILPSNETYAATQPNGKGSAKFDMWTGQSDPDLGCSTTTACALVAIPIMGISCDPAMTGMPADDQIPADQLEQAATQCEQTGHWLPGQQAAVANLEFESDPTVTGALWWAASNWRNRFVVPLTFAPPQDICAIVAPNNHLISVYGSELMYQVELQWNPHSCLQKHEPYTIQYSAEPEPEAAASLQGTEDQPGKPPPGSVEAALVTDQPPGGFGKPVVHAPVAATGFAISFIIDNAAGQQVTRLRLDPRLLAKLLTESYTGNNTGDYGGADPELTHPCPGVPIPGSTLCTNPVSIMQDPEFLALNPGLTFNSAEESGDSYAGAALLALSSQSDVMYALTSYIEANPAARAWLNGTPDPWGMTVNKKYKGKLTALPTNLWSLNSTWEPPGWTNPNNAGDNECYFHDPSPILPLIAAPVQSLFSIAEYVQFADVQADVACTGYDPTNPLGTDQLSALGEQTPGFRFMIGLTTIADADRYDLTTASLLTHTKPGTPAAFTSADVTKDMTFVSASDASLRAATALLHPDKTADDWSFPYSLYQNDSEAAASAYPGTMLVYMDVPTSDLPAADATDFAKYVKYAVSEGQRPGGAVGQLPAGYLPMTAANHLGAEDAYALAAAKAITAQKGAIPPLTPSKGSSTSSPSPSSSATSSSGSGSSSTGSGSSASSTSSSPSPGPSPLKSAKAVAQLTPVQSFGVAGYLLPVIAGLAIVGGAAAFLVSRLSRWRSR
jgi:hypothetical protein